MSTPEPETHTVQTRYGEAEIAVVECDSCGAEIAKTDAEPFTIGAEPTRREGWACEHCAAEGPADFPRWSAPAGYFPATVLLAPVSVAVALNDASDGELSERQLLFLTGVVGGVFWIGVFAILTMLFTASQPPGGEVPPL